MPAAVARPYQPPLFARVASGDQLAEDPVPVRAQRRDAVPSAADLDLDLYLARSAARGTPPNTNRGMPAEGDRRKPERVEDAFRLVVRERAAAQVEAAVLDQMGRDIPRGSNGHGSRTRRRQIPRTPGPVQSLGGPSGRGFRGEPAGIGRLRVPVRTRSPRTGPDGGLSERPARSAARSRRVICGRSPGRPRPDRRRGGSARRWYRGWSTRCRMPVLSRQPPGRGWRRPRMQSSRRMKSSGARLKRLSPRARQPRTDDQVGSLNRLHGRRERIDERPIQQRRHHLALAELRVRSKSRSWAR